MASASTPFQSTAATKTHGSLTIVIKLGSSSIIHETTHQPLLSLLSSIVETVITLKQRGHRVVLVSSGAIAVGVKRMELKGRPKTLSGKQALAAIGQGRLIALWDNLFGQLGQPIAQILLTRGDLSDRTRYLNTCNALAELLSLGVIPIVNENDTISVSEIKFGDNDTLSPITASMINADFLFLLTDVDGLYTSNPRKDPSLNLIAVVDSVSDIRSKVSTKTLGSSLGTGGMETKLIAADIATAAGVQTIIASSQNPKRVIDIVEWTISSSSSPSTSAPTTTTMSSHSPSPIPNSRPIHTSFTPSPSPTPLRSLKSWTFHTLFLAGSVIIDHGAHSVLSRRDSGGRLLPIGIIGIIGSFASGQAVRILVRKRPSSVDVPEHLKMDDLNSIPPTSTRLSRKPSIDFNTTTGVSAPDSFNTDSHHSNPHEQAQDLPSTPSPSTPIPDEDLLEVGRGLSNYNSADMDKIKGQKSTIIMSILGYVESEYVVENITIRSPP